MDAERKPFIYDKNWLVFSNSTFNNLEILDCDDTVHGVCLRDISLDQCIEACKEKNEYCGAGYHINFKNGKSLCAPLRTSIHPNLNPLHRLVDQDKVPELEGTVVTTFVDTTKFEYPPNHANTVFYRDIISLKNVNTGLFFGSRKHSLDDGEITAFSDNAKTSISLLKQIKSAVQASMYMPVKYGDRMGINVANTTMVLKRGANIDNLVWEHSVGFTEEDFPFRLKKLKSTGKNDIVVYGDEFLIEYIYDNYYAVLNTDNNTFEVRPGPYEKILRDKEYNPVFTFVSKMKGWYCDGGKCESVPIADIEKRGVGGTYNGSTVFRHTSCFDTCKGVPSPLTKAFNTIKKPNTVIIILACVLAITFLIFVIKIVLKKKRT